MYALPVWAVINHSGPYSQGDETAHEIDPAVLYNSTAILEWATGYLNYLRSDGGTTFADPSEALGAASSNIYDIVSLGDLNAASIAAGNPQGKITLTFDTPIGNGAGTDFAVFENDFANDFCELAYVEVSTDGVHFVRFESYYAAATAPVGSYAFIDATYIFNLAGKHKVGYGTPFNLDGLADAPDVVNGLVDLNNIQYVRLIDIPGSGGWTDAFGHPIYDSWLTTGSGGVDLDAVGVLHLPSAILAATSSSAQVADGDATNADVITFSIEFSEPVANLEATDFTVSNANVSNLSGSATTYTFEITPLADGEVTVALPFGKCQSTTFAGKQNQPLNTYAFISDKTPPTVAIGSPDPAETSSGPVTYVVTYSGADDISLNVGDVTLETTGDANASSVQVVNAGGAVRHVTLSAISGDGTLAIRIGAGTASDAAGNMAPEAGPSSPVIINGTIPMSLAPWPAAMALGWAFYRALRRARPRQKQ